MSVTSFVSQLQNLVSKNDAQIFFKEVNLKHVTSKFATKDMEGSE